MTSGIKARSEATIFALASGAGRAGVAVIRLSGPASGAACRALTDKDAPAPRHAAFRRFIAPASGEVIDQGLVLWFEGPSSFTGEDVLELHVHGGPAVLEALFNALATLPDVRPADAGEFSRRAFMNGKMDLTEAEGLADLIAAETSQQARQARRQMDGVLGRLYRSWHEVLVEALAHVEAEIDFAPDEEVPHGLLEGMRPALDELRSTIEGHLSDRRGECLRGGLEVALIGPTNAGKSSLINILSKRDIAIVTDIPGTTRDILEVPLDLDGYPLKVIDMAGLRRTKDPVEEIGVERARNRARSADFCIALFDGAVWPELDRETLSMIDHRTITVLNKIDLVSEGSDVEIGGQRAIPLSCLRGDGVDQLVTLLSARARKGMEAGDVPLLTRSRHRDALNEVLGSLERLNADGEMEMALAAEELRLAMVAMGRITGRVGTEDLLNRIFGEFCIGK